MSQEKLFCVVIPAYNCEDYVEKNLTSVLSQKYNNFFVVYINDNSSDKTLEKAKEVIQRFNIKVKIRNNPTQQLRGKNIYQAIIEDSVPDAIAVLVDGDDWLAHDQVLQKLNQTYQNNNIWVTFGGFLFHPPLGSQDKKLYNLYYPEEWIMRRAYRNTRWAAPHLLTFYTWLYYLIKKEDLQMNGEFITYAEDCAMTFPLLEMAGNRVHCLVDEDLYIYNRSNPIGTANLGISYQQSETEIAIRMKPIYPNIFP